MMWSEREDPGRKEVFKGKNLLFEREHCRLKGGIAVLHAAKDLVGVEGNAGRRVGW